MKKYTNWGMVVLPEDFINHNIAELEAFQPREFFIQYKEGGQNIKLKYDEAYEKYFGYTLQGKLYRWYKEPNEAKVRTTSLVAFGKICIWGDASLSEPSESNGAFTYKYCFGEGLSYVSADINGSILILTNENFGKVIGEIDEQIMNSYLEEIQNISDVDLKKYVTSNKEGAQLFLRYFEMINNL